ncbi:MAG TPA: alpha/beta hydrolase [Ilumatobacteraceae bacterium]
MEIIAAPAALDAEVQAALEAFPAEVRALVAGLSDDSIAAVRATMSSLPVPALSDAVTRTDHAIPGTDRVVVRVHRPASAVGALPCLYWMHGGGLVFGSYTDEDARFDRWSPQFGLVGVSVEYRLAPETPFPGPLEDCYAGLQWVHHHAAEIGIDPARIGVGGRSAGGNLAAGLALLARDRGGVPLRYQLLMYPMLDDRQATTSSAWNDPIWPPPANTYGWTAYLGPAKGGPAVSPYAAPSRTADLAGLPPTLMAVGSIDGFCDEDIDYAVRLRHAGVAVDLAVYAGGPHSFDSIAPNSALGRRAQRDIEEWLGRHAAAVR